MKDKIINYSVLTINFVQSLLESESIENVIQETQRFCIDLIEELVFELEPNEDYEQCALNLQICKSVFLPIIQNQNDIPEELAKQVVQNKIDELLESFRNQRDTQQDERAL